MNIFLSAMIALSATFFISKKIDELYEIFFSELSFPDEIGQRKIYRKIFLFVGIFFCANILMKLPAPQNFYSIAAAIFLLTFTVTDLEQQIIFDRILFSFAVLGFIATIHLSLPILNHLLAAISGGIIFLLIAILTKSIGGGDIKLIFVLGLYFGTEKLFSIIVLGMIFAGFSALILFLTKKIKHDDKLAYAPYFTITAIYLLLKTFL